MQRDERPELARVERPVGLDALDVGQDEPDRARDGVRDADVVRAEHARREEPEDLPDLRRLQQRAELPDQVLRRPEAERCERVVPAGVGVGRQLVGHRATQCVLQPRRGRFHQWPVGVDRARDPVGASRERHTEQVVRRFEPREVDDLEFGDAEGVLQPGARRLGRLGVAARLRGARHGELACELPLHRPRRAAHHALELTEQRRVAQRLGIHPEGELWRRHRSQPTTCPGNGLPTTATMAP
jgi:hypothetical protein